MSIQPPILVQATQFIAEVCYEQIPDDAFTIAKRAILDYIGVASHYEAITRGVIDSKDMIYFFSLIFLGLLATEAILSRRNITN